MNAVVIRGLTKSFRGLHAVDHLDMTVPVGSIYGFIGENGSGKSTTEKIVCGHLVPGEGTIRLFGRPHTDPGVRVRVGALIENAGCFPDQSVWDNLAMQAINLGLPHRSAEIDRVLGVVRMQEASKLKFKKCSAGMGLDVTAMCNINLLYFGAALFVAMFVSEDFSGGYAKSLFTVRPRVRGYVASKIVTCALACALMLLAFFAGAVVGGAAGGLPLALGELAAADKG